MPPTLESLEATVDGQQRQLDVISGRQDRIEDRIDAIHDKVDALYMLGIRLLWGVVITIASSFVAPIILHALTSR